MTQKCVDYFRKWKKEPNFCGVGKATENTINKYLEFADEFSNTYKFDIDLVYRNVPQTAVKPLLKFKKDSDIRTKVMKQIAQTLSDKHAISLRYVQQLIGLEPKSKPLVISPAVAAISEIPQEAFTTNSIKDKIRLITSALPSGQIDMLDEIMKKKDLDNEYAALILAIKTAWRVIKDGD